jgi:hypothetical protein
MRFFFYGTLMDRDVVARVLARPVIREAMKPAILRGWRRTCVHGASYPIVLRDKASQVDGMTLDGISKVESERLSAYEGPRYSLIRAFADLPQQGPRAVFLFVPRVGTFRATHEEWSLTAWQEMHKQKFLALLGRDGEGRASAADRR